MWVGHSCPTKVRPCRWLGHFGVVLYVQTRARAPARHLPPLLPAWYHAAVSDSACLPNSVSVVSATTTPPRHAALVRVTHWITTLCFFALLVSGMEIVISHPRFYWGETGNVLTPPLFKIPIPSSRAKVPTGYGYVLPDQNGWSRYLHFQSAWVAGADRPAVCDLASVFDRAFARRICCRCEEELSWRVLAGSIADHSAIQAAERRRSVVV